MMAHKKGPKHVVLLKRKCLMVKVKIKVSCYKPGKAPGVPGG
jgi:hypothetical protein